MLATYYVVPASLPATGSAKELPTGTVYLRVTVTGPAASCRFSYSTDGTQFQTIGKPFTATPGKWIGAKVGLFCVRQPDARTGGYADFDWFRID